MDESLMHRVQTSLRAFNSRLVESSIQSVSGGRGVSPVIGVVLLVAIAVVLSGIVGVFALNLGGSLNEDPAGVDTTVRIEQTEGGSIVEAQNLASDVTVLVDGVEVADFREDEAGETRFIPTAPGDKVMVVSQQKQSSVVVNQQVDKYDSQSFIVYYDFEGSGSTIVDQSQYGNDGVFKGGSIVRGSDSNGDYVAFDGNDDHIAVPSLISPDSRKVESFTVAAKYRITGSTGAVQQIVEHRNDSEDFEWHVETSSFSGSSYDSIYRVYGIGGNPDTGIREPLSVGDTVVVLATYDGDKMRYYVDGTLVATKDAADQDVYMGGLFLGADALLGNSQYLEGRMYDFRLYYTDLSDTKAKRVMTMMNRSS